MRAGDPECRVLERGDVVVDAAVGVRRDRQQRVERVVIEEARCLTRFIDAQDLDVVTGGGLDHGRVREARENPERVDQVVAQRRCGLGIAEELDVHLVPQAERREVALCGARRAGTGTTDGDAFAFEVGDGVDAAVGLDDQVRRRAVQIGHRVHVRILARVVGQPADTAEVGITRVDDAEISLAGVDAAQVFERAGRSHVGNLDVFEGL